MANQNKPVGLSPVRYLNGAPYNGQVSMYHVNSGGSNAIYVGDPVKLIAGVEGIAGEANGLQTVDIGAAGATCVGVVVAVGITPRGGPYINPNNLGYNALNTQYVPASRTIPYFVAVADDPNIIFEIQEGGTGTELTVAATSKNANFAIAAPATGNFLSGTYLDIGTAPATTSTYNLKIMGLSQKLDPSSGLYNTYGPYAKWLCLLNNHSYRTGVAGV